MKQAGRIFSIMETDNCPTSDGAESGKWYKKMDERKIELLKILQSEGLVGDVNPLDLELPCQPFDLYTPGGCGRHVGRVYDNSIAVDKYPELEEFLDKYQFK
jgi:hypothetical protein|tara:strand:+ start:382 stop:687 length:306 start_codon:yes stop_codon:yes gene_type:complete